MKLDLVARRNRRQQMLVGYICSDVRALVERYGYIAVRQAVMETTWGAAERRIPRWIFPDDVAREIDGMIAEQDKRELGG